MTIKELRVSRNLTQAKFAEMIGVDRSDLGKMENGKKNISDRIHDRIWEVFGVEVGVEEGKKLVKKVSVPKLEIYIQSPLGGNITPEEVAARMPEGTEACFVRVDQNKIWWVRGNGETGYVWIWD
ncbi:MAG: helix-turn-helix transcriptional regulator [Clostridia bacterium]|nr:helix-turn-helix transcriptional regulator [Clostridia bacterium]